MLSFSYWEAFLQFLRICSTFHLEGLLGLVHYNLLYWRRENSMYTLSAKLRITIKKIL